MTEKMKEVLLYCLAEEYELYPEDYSKRTIRALEKKGLLDVDDDWYEITEKGIRSLGLPATVRVKKDTMGQATTVMTSMNVKMLHRATQMPIVKILLVLSHVNVMMDISKVQNHVLNAMTLAKLVMSKYIINLFILIQFLVRMIIIV